MRAPQYQPMLHQVRVELSRGHISEGFIVEKGWNVDGWIDHGSHHITINPTHATIDTVIHELLHRLHPNWSEGYVRNRTSWLRNRMTDHEVQQLYGEYLAIVKRLKQVKRIN